MAWKNKEREKEYNQQYWILHKEGIKQYRALHKEERKEYDKEYHKQYYPAHKEEKKQYQASRKEKTKEYWKQYRVLNKEKINEHQRQYLKTPAGKETDKRHYSKRKNLGFNPLNNYFDGLDAHHINENDVIYIPKDLHRSIYHNLRTGKNMNIINTLAIQYLFGNYIIYGDK